MVGGLGHIGPQLFPFGLRFLPPTHWNRSQPRFRIALGYSVMPFQFHIISIASANQAKPVFVWDNSIGLDAVLCRVSIKNPDP
jgi:hypothetical protein